MSPRGVNEENLFAREIISKKINKEILFFGCSLSGFSQPCNLFPDLNISLSNLSSDLQTVFFLNSQQCFQKVQCRFSGSGDSVSTVPPPGEGDVAEAEGVQALDGALQGPWGPSYRTRKRGMVSNSLEALLFVGTT